MKFFEKLFGSKQKKEHKLTESLSKVLYPSHPTYPIKIKKTAAVLVQFYDNSMRHFCKILGQDNIEDLSITGGSENITIRCTYTNENVTETTFKTKDIQKLTIKYKTITFTSSNG